MSKSLLNIKAQELRRNGESIKQIANKLNVSKGSVSWWVRDILLTEDQIINLSVSEEKGKALGRLKVIHLKRDKKSKLLEEIDQAGIKRLPDLTDNELFVAGLALYWAEGGKSNRNRRVEFCNSDPSMIKFLLVWLKKCFSITKPELRCVVGINQIHRKRDELVKEHWSELTGIPLNQFRKTSFKKVKNNKTYENMNEHYGTLTILVVKSTNLYYQIMGLIKALGQSKLTAA